jgi:hypothetical protein
MVYGVYTMADIGPNSDNDPILSLFGIPTDSNGPRDGSINYKHDLYGAPKRKRDGSWKMRRKQIYLTVQQEDAIRRIAGERGVPESVVIREAMTAYLAEEHEPYDPAVDFEDIMGTAADPIVQMGKLGGSGVPDASLNYKRDLYGAPERRQ